MDGIPDLITRWLAGGRRTRKELGELCDVEPRTAGRWAKGETTPQGEDLERLALVLSADLGIDPEGVYGAAREDRRRDQDYLPRSGTSLRVVGGDIVISSTDKATWRAAVMDDENLSPGAREVLRTFTAYFGMDGQPEVVIDREVLVSDWGGLTLEKVDAAWLEVVESPYVSKRPVPGWVFWLQFPDD